MALPVDAQPWQLASQQLPLQPVWQFSVSLLPWSVCCISSCAQCDVAVAGISGVAQLLRNGAAASARTSSARRNLFNCVCMQSPDYACEGPRARGNGVVVEKSCFLGWAVSTV